MAASRQERKDPDAIEGPVGLCDTHVHVFDPARFPYAPSRRFTPGVAGVDRLTAHLDAIGAPRVVLVQPSVYASDHGCLLAALDTLGARARGVGVVAEDADAAGIAALDAAGVRGARLNLVVDGIDSFDILARRYRSLDATIPAHWHIQLHVRLDLLHLLADSVRASGRHVVLDHMGLAAGADVLSSPEWKTLQALVREGHASVKLSAPYLCGAGVPPHADLEAPVRCLAAANPRALLWGSNWPHTQGVKRQQAPSPESIEPFRRVDDRLWLRQCIAWLAQEGAAERVLDDNAARLYGFPTAACA